MTREKSERGMTNNYRLAIYHLQKNYIATERTQIELSPKQTATHSIPVYYKTSFWMKDWSSKDIHSRVFQKEEWQNLRYLLVSRSEKWTYNSCCMCFYLLVSDCLTCFCCRSTTFSYIFYISLPFNISINLCRCFFYYIL